MAEDPENTGNAAKPPKAAQPAGDADSELPAVKSPPLSPANDKAEILHSAIAIYPPTRDEGARSAAPRFRLRPRHKRQAVLAASVAIAAALGAIVGALATGGTHRDSAGLQQQQQQMMQQQIGQLSKEVASLKTSLETGAKSANSRIAKISERLERLAPETTGSIPVPPAAIPTPVPRPAMRTAAAENHVVPDWSIYDVRGGYVYVRGHGDIYQVVPGAPLPGLGPVQEIKRRNGRWVVVTPRGLIVSLRDRPRFEPY